MKTSRWLGSAVMALTLTLPLPALAEDGAAVPRTVQAEPGSGFALEADVLALELPVFAADPGVQYRFGSPSLTRDGLALTPPEPQQSPRRDAGRSLRRTLKRAFDARFSLVPGSEPSSIGAELGLLNYSRRLEALQVGLVHIGRDSGGVQFGLVNVFETGVVPLYVLWHAAI